LERYGIYAERMIAIESDTNAISIDHSTNCTFSNNIFMPYTLGAVDYMYIGDSYCTGMFWNILHFMILLMRELGLCIWEKVDSPKHSHRQRH